VNANDKVWKANAGVLQQCNHDIEHGGGKERDALSKVNSLTAGRLLSGFRVKSAIDMQSLIGLMTAFSNLLLKMADQITSVDLNPVICSPRGCMVVDARIILKV
jgi:hypothetical protein